MPEKIEVITPYGGFKKGDYTLVPRAKAGKTEYDTMRVKDVNPAFPGAEHVWILSVRRPHPWEWLFIWLMDLISWAKKNF